VLKLPGAHAEGGDQRARLCAHENDRDEHAHARQGHFHGLRAGRDAVLSQVRRAFWLGYTKNRYKLVEIEPWQ